MAPRISLGTASRLVALAMVLLGLAACGPALDSRYVTAVVAPSATTTASPLPSATLAVPTPTATSAAPVPAPGQPAVRRGIFPLIPFGSRAAFGTATVSVDGMGFVVSVAAAGLVPGSAHSVHLHTGSCASASFGRHLLILGTMVANGAGSGAIASRVGLGYATGRYVIVYANLSPATIIGCADLGSI